MADNNFEPSPERRVSGAEADNAEAHKVAAEEHRHFAETYRQKAGDAASADSAKWARRAGAAHGDAAGAHERANEVHQDGGMPTEVKEHHSKIAQEYSKSAIAVSDQYNSRFNTGVGQSENTLQKLGKVLDGTAQARESEAHKYR